jgi:lysine-N-methylase
MRSLSTRIERPRLGGHVLARRHASEGTSQVVLDDLRGGRVLVIDERAWTFLSCADGTRDVVGIRAAASRLGARASTADLAAFFAKLADAGLLDDGAPPDPLRGERTRRGTTPEDRALVVLPGYGLHCDGSGGCCRNYESILVTPEDVSRALATMPYAHAGTVSGDDLFLPKRGSAPTPMRAVSLRNGACAFLDPDGRCGLHARGGAAAKPIGCAAFPAILCDDGEVVRVSATVECACVLASAGRSGGEPLVPTAARVLADLPITQHVEQLPDRLAATRERTIDRATARALADALFEHALVDPPATLWALADALECGEDRVPTDVTQPAFASVIPRIELLHRRASARASVAASWREEGDRIRRATATIAAVALILREPAPLAEIQSDASWRADEAFYVRAFAFARRFGNAPVAEVLREYALRLWVARALPLVDPDESHPLALVEAMARAHGC